MLSLEKRGLWDPDGPPPAAAPPATAAAESLVAGGIGGILEASCLFLSRCSGSNRIRGVCASAGSEESIALADPPPSLTSAAAGAAVELWEAEEADCGTCVCGG